MELMIFLLLFAASVTVGIAAARGFFYLIFRFLMRDVGSPLAVAALPRNSAS
jgi:hypothetical protein